MDIYNNICKICGETGRILGSKRGVKVFNCPQCSFLWKDPGSLSDQYHKTWKKEIQIGEAFRNQSDIYAYRLAQIIKFSGHNVKKVLDLGCGKGEFVEYLRKKGYDAYGCDINSCIPDKEYFFNQDLSSVPIKSFDLITSIETFEHLEDPGSMMKKIAGKLKPEGFLYIQTHYTHTRTLFGWRYFNYAEHLSFYPPASMKILMAKNNIDLIYYDNKKQPFYFTGFISRNLVHLWCRFSPVFLKQIVLKLFNRPRIGLYEGVNKKKIYVKDMLKIANCVYVGKKSN